MTVAEMIAALQAVPGDLEVMVMEKHGYELDGAVVDLARRLPPNVPFEGMHDWKWEKDKRRWLYHVIMPNVWPSGQRRRDELPWMALIVMGDLGPAEGHECFCYTPEEGCFVEGHDNYQFVAWIDDMGKAHYQS